MTAAYDKSSLKKHMSRPSLVEMAKLPTISTPQYVVRTHNIAADITCFSLNSGDYVPYHVMQSSTAVESSTSSTPQSMSAPEVQSHQSTNPSADDLKVKDRLHAESSSLKSSSFSPLMQPRLAALAGEHTKSMYSTNQVSAIRSAPDNMCEPGKALSREGKLNFKDLFLPPPPPPSSSQVLPSSSSSHSEHRKPSLAVDTSPPGSHILSGAERIADTWLVEYIDLVCSPASAANLGCISGENELDLRLDDSACSLSLTLRSSADGLVD